jgi:hypothetical protein
MSLLWAQTAVTFLLICVRTVKSYESVYFIVKIIIPSITNHKKERKGEGAGRFTEGWALQLFLRH